MPASLRVAAAAVQSQPAPWWRDPEERACERAMDDLLGHDVDRIARRTGMKRRRLNEQRESEHAANNWLRRLVLVVATVREIGGEPARWLPALRLLGEVAGGRFIALTDAQALAATPTEVLVTRTAADVCESIAVVAEITADRVIETRELPRLLEAIDGAIARLQQLRESLTLRAVPRRSLSPRSIPFQEVRPC
jgi:hypothetical protein